MKARAIGENAVTAVGGVVLRISMVYGGISNFMGTYFNAASRKFFDLLNQTEEKIKFWGTDQDYIATIHIDDLVAGYLKIIENNEKVRGEIFNLTSYNETKLGILYTVAKHVGGKVS
jgi:nucleoside-diphosphate-sugar epimerase